MTVEYSFLIGGLQRHAWKILPRVRVVGNLIKKPLRYS